LLKYPPDAPVNIAKSPDPSPCGGCSAGSGVSRGRRKGRCTTGAERESLEFGVAWQSKSQSEAAADSALESILDQV